MDEETVTISTELLDRIVALLGELPYLQAQPVFAQMAHELTNEEPKIQLN